MFSSGGSVKYYLYFTKWRPGRSEEDKNSIYKNMKLLNQINYF